MVYFLTMVSIILAFACIGLAYVNFMKKKSNRTENPQNGNATLIVAENGQNQKVERRWVVFST